MINRETVMNVYGDIVLVILSASGIYLLIMIIKDEKEKKEKQQKEKTK